MGIPLYAISSLSDAKRKGGAYKVFGIQYAQYAKADADYTYTHNFTPRTSMAAHIGMGIGVPYGNSSVIPFEKRFYAGGANGVRGWGVRTLGPGSYNSKNSVSDFINQCGDIRLFMSLEFRQKLFWVLEGAFLLMEVTSGQLEIMKINQGAYLSLINFTKKLPRHTVLG